MKLELKHIVNYFPYDLEMIFESKGGRKIKLSSISITPLGIAFSGGSGGMWLAESNFKPILRPLSDLINDTYDFIYNKEYDYPSIEDWINLDYESKLTCKFSYEFWQLLYKHHFDIYNLIENNLAIDINTLK